MTLVLNALKTRHRSWSYWPAEGHYDTTIGEMYLVVLDDCCWYVGHLPTETILARGTKDSAIEAARAAERYVHQLMAPLPITVQFDTVVAYTVGVLRRSGRLAVFSAQEGKVVSTFDPTETEAVVAEWKRLNQEAGFEVGTEAIQRARQRKL